MDGVDLIEHRLRRIYRSYEFLLVKRKPGTKLMFAPRVVNIGLNVMLPLEQRTDDGEIAHGNVRGARRWVSRRFSWAMYTDRLCGICSRCNGKISQDIRNRRIRGHGFEHTQTGRRRCYERCRRSRSMQRRVFVCAKNKEFILDNRTADSASKAVVVKIRLCRNCSA